jgi:hypothetical protein
MRAFKVALFGAFNQTMKKFLAMQDITSPQQLQLDRYVAYSNEMRPHRGMTGWTGLAE